MITISLLCENIDILLPTIRNTFNDTLTTDIVPLDFKTVVVNPLLENKTTLDHNALTNYSHVSNLSFLPKTVQSGPFPKGRS